MSTIEKLSIQGVRSFGSNAEDAQSITFSSPITLILGQNGCGKTTVIECLKYALTGECPPRSDSGKSFVHDPKIFGRTETVAQVKMVVRDKSNARLSICRSMKVSIIRGRATFKTLDSTLTKMGREEEKKNKGKLLESISLRNVNMDEAVSSFMGVSKHIINNVLFCHQEDSSWPLDEAKKLKEKFDDIFGIKDYNTALEKINKLIKTSKQNLKVKEEGLKYLAHLKKEMDNKTMCLQKAEQKSADIKLQCEDCENQFKPIDDRLEEIKNIEHEIGTHNAKKVELDTRHKNCIEQIGKLSKQIKKPFTGSLSALEEEISNFGERMNQMVIERTEIEELLAQKKSRNIDLHRTLATHDKGLVIAQQKQKSENECIKQLESGIRQFCVHLKINIDFNTKDNPEKLSECLKATLENKQCELAELTVTNEQSDHGRQVKIDELRTEVTKTEQSLKTHKSQMHSYEKESEELELKVKQIELSLHQLKALDKKISDTDEKYERAASELDEKASRQSIAEKKSSIAEKRVRFRQLDEKLTLLNSVGKLMAEINLKEKELDKKNQEIHRVKSKHSTHFGKFFKEPITGNYRRSLQNASEKLRREIQSLNETVNAQKLLEQEFGIKRKNLQIEVARIEKELQQSEDRIYQKCHSKPYEELLLASKTTIAKLQLQKGEAKSSEAMYKIYIQKMNEEKDCPLCHHEMSEDNITDLTTELSDEIENLPENIARIEKSLQAEESKRDNLLQLKPTIERVQELMKTLPEKKKELQQVEEQLGDSVTQYETVLALIGEPTAHMELANSMLHDMTLLDEALKESARLKKDLDQLKLKLPKNYDDSVSTEDLQAEKSLVSKEVDTESKSLETLQQNFELQKETVNKLREFRNSLKDQRIKLQEGQQSLPSLKERGNELTRLLITISAEIKEFTANLQPLKLKLESAVVEKARLKRIEHDNWTKMNTSYNNYKIVAQDIERLNIQAHDFAKLNLESKIKSLTALISQTKAQIAELEISITNCSEQLDLIKTKCVNHENDERDLKDNRDLKQLQSNEQKLKEKCAALDKQLAIFDYKSISAEKRTLMKQKDKYSVRRGELHGQLGEINVQVRRLEGEINDPKFKNSLRNYRRAQFEVAVKERGINDLTQYSAAMDWALIQFHAEKMRNINSLIRQYWRMIYKGNDIDYIQIKTEPDNESSSSRRKSYNYRVVQTKNNSEIEMRGRCSAGQRVLGSLIIRMALAETFSSNCGVLALDEPTTNLDKDNIMSLCEALNSIVEERQAQSNFMLIIITHDEEFISALGRINSYYRVERNSQSKSVIKIMSVDAKSK